MALKTKSLRRLCLKWLNVRNQLHRSFSQNTTELKLKQQSHFHEASLGNRLTRKLWASRLCSRVYKKRQFYWLKPVFQCMNERLQINSLSRERQPFSGTDEVAINGDKSILSSTQIQSTLSAYTQRMAFPKKKIKKKQQQNSPPTLTWWVPKSSNEKLTPRVRN